MSTEEFWQRVNRNVPSIFFAHHAILMKFLELEIFTIFTLIKQLYCTANTTVPFLYATNPYDMILYETSRPDFNNSLPNDVLCNFTARLGEMRIEEIIAYWQPNIILIY